MGPSGTKPPPQRHGGGMSGQGSAWGGTARPLGYARGDRLKKPPAIPGAPWACPRGRPGIWAASVPPHLYCAAVAPQTARGQGTSVPPVTSRVAERSQRHACRLTSVIPGWPAANSRDLVRYGHRRGLWLTPVGAKSAGPWGRWLSVPSSNTPFTACGHELREFGLTTVSQTVVA